MNEEKKFVIDFLSILVILALAIVIVVISHDKAWTQHDKVLQLTQMYDDGVNDALDCVVLKVLALQTQSISITWKQVQKECRETLNVSGITTGSSRTSDRRDQKVSGFFSH